MSRTLLASPQDVTDPVIASQGGNPVGTLIVYLVGEDGKPVIDSGVVTILRAGEVSGPYQRTESSGVVRFTQLANATYTVIVSVAGYKDQRSEADITRGNTVAEVTVPMERATDDTAKEARSQGITLAPKAKKEAQKGIDAMRAGNYDEAQKHLEAAYHMAPGNPDLNDRMAELFIVTKNLDKAQLYLQQAVSIEPDNASALTDIGWLCVQQGDNVAAEIALEHAIRVDPRRWFAHWLLGVSYLRQGKFEQAYGEAVTAMRLGKGAAVDAKYLAGESLAALGRNAEAIKTLENLVREVPDNPDAAAARNLIAKLEAAGNQVLGPAPASGETSTAEPAGTIAP